MAQRDSKDLTIKDEKIRDKSNVLYDEHQQKRVNKLLKMKIKDANGKSTNMFAFEVANGTQRYCCLLCSKSNMDLSKLVSHVGGAKHNLKLQFVDEKRSSPDIRIGSAVKVSSELQGELDKITDQVMIGVEYMIEVSFGDTFESIFHCVLCDGKFDLQVVIHHLTSYVHRLNYLEKHFPTAFKKVSAMEKREQKYGFLVRICQNIEDYYGRLPVKVVQRDEFNTNHAICYESVLNGKHIDEKMGRTFIDTVDLNEINELSPVSLDETNSTCGLESISTSSEYEMSPNKAAGKVLLRPSKSMRRSHKLHLSPLSPERTLKLDKKLRSSSYDPNAPNGGCRRKKSKHTDEKCSLRAMEKSPKRKCTHKKDRKDRAGVSQSSDRSRSRSPQSRHRSRSSRGHQFFTTSYRQAPEDYTNHRTYDYYESQQKSTVSSGRTESAFFTPNHDIADRANYLLNYKGHYNYPIETVTTKELRRDFRSSIPTSMEWKINERSNRADYPMIYSREYNHPTDTLPTSMEWGNADGEFALSRSSLGRSDRPDYSLSGYSCRTEMIPTSMDYREYVLSRSYRERTNRTDYSRSYGDFNHAKEAELAKDYRPAPNSIEPDTQATEPITIISVLSLLSAFENLLGSLGPKMIELMTEAIAMETVGINFSNTLLDDMNHCIIFETTKEKLKGLLSAGIVEDNTIVAVKRTIRHMDVLIDEANARKRLRPGMTSSVPSQMESDDRSVAKRILAIMNEQGKTISNVQLAQYVEQYMSLTSGKECDDDREGKSSMDKVVGKSYKECKNVEPIITKMELDHIRVKTEPTIAVNKNSPILADSKVVETITTDTQTKPICEKANPTAVASTDSSAFVAIPSTTLSDSNLTTLIKNFAILSDTEKHEVITNIRDIEIREPERMQRLRSQLDVKNFLKLKAGTTKLADDKTMVRTEMKSETVE